MTKYSITKNPGADHVVALSKGDGATPFEITKNPGNETVNIQKNATTKARIVKTAGQSLIGAGVDNILMESGDNLLLETGDAILLE